MFRVVVVKLIIERENLIKEFEGKPIYKIHGTFDLPISKKKSVLLEAEFSKDIEKGNRWKKAEN